MPGKQIATKNRFARKSKLGESEFATIVLLYLQGMSAPQARAEYAAMDHPSAANPPSTKTLARIFRRLGRYLFHKLAEARVVLEDSRLVRVRHDDYDTYDKIIDKVAQRLIDQATTALNYQDYRILSDEKPWMEDTDGFNFEIRKLSAARQGIKSDPRADVGLAYFMVITTNALPRNTTEEEKVHFMLKSLLEWLRDLPLEPDGNPHQLFPNRPNK